MPPPEPLHRVAVCVRRAAAEHGRLLADRLPATVAIDVVDFERAVDADAGGAESPVLSSAAALYCDGDAIAPLAAAGRMPKLAFVQCSWAGVDALFKPVPKALRNTASQLPTRPAFRLCRMAGFYGRLMAEYTLALVVGRERRFAAAAAAQAEKRWAKEQLREYRCLSQLTVLIVGFGEIGKEVARAFKLFQSRVLAVKTKLPDEPDANVDQYGTMSDLPEFLSQCDYCVSILPRTDGTDGVYNGDVLSNCSAKQGVFVNIGRGNVISECELLKALRNKWIGGAILDVFECEPLPGDSQLWHEDNVVITPHVSAETIATMAVDTFVDNWTRFVEGKQLLYQVDWDRHY